MWAWSLWEEWGKKVRNMGSGKMKIGSKFQYDILWRCMHRMLQFGFHNYTVNWAILHIMQIQCEKCKHQCMEQNISNVVAISYHYRFCTKIPPIFKTCINELFRHIPVCWCMCAIRSHMLLMSETKLLKVYRRVWNNSPITFLLREMFATVLWNHSEIYYASRCQCAFQSKPIARLCVLSFEVWFAHLDKLPALTCP